MRVKLALGKPRAIATRMRETLSILAGVALLIAGGARWAEYRRHHRRNLDVVGIMPWSLVFILALLAAATCIALLVRVS